MDVYFSPLLQTSCCCARGKKVGAIWFWDAPPQHSSRFMSHTYHTYIFMYIFRSFEYTCKIARATTKDKKKRVYKIFTIEPLFIYQILINMGIKYLFHFVCNSINVKLLFRYYYFFFFFFLTRSLALSLWILFVTHHATVSLCCLFIYFCTHLTKVNNDTK